jgi:hypothetical protein
MEPAEIGWIMKTDFNLLPAREHGEKVTFHWNFVRGQPQRGGGNRHQGPESAEGASLAPVRGRWTTKNKESASGAARRYQSHTACFIISGNAGQR